MHVLRPRVPALTRRTPLLLPSPRRRQAAQPRCPGPDRIRPKPQGLCNSKRNAHPFLNNLARRASLLPRAPPRDCTTCGLERQGVPIGFGWSPSPQFLALASLSNVACCCLMLLTPCHAMPLADVLMLMTDGQAPGRVLVLVLALLGNSSSDMSFVLHSSSPTVHYSAASSRATCAHHHSHTARGVGLELWIAWAGGSTLLVCACAASWLAGPTFYCAVHFPSSVLTPMEFATAGDPSSDAGAPVSKRCFPNTAAHARPCPYAFQSVSSWWRWTVEGRRDFPYLPTLVLPSQERLLEFIFPVLLRWLLRAACYATLRLAWLASCRSKKDPSTLGLHSQLSKSSKSTN